MTAIIKPLKPKYIIIATTGRDVPDEVKYDIAQGEAHLIYTKGKDSFKQIIALLKNRKELRK